jgi:phosphatidate cytidylyltransferase
VVLGQRVITAVVLLALLVPALFAPMAWPFAAFTLALVAAAGWEWGRLNGLPSAPALGLGALTVGLALLLAAAQAPAEPSLACALGALAWAVVGGSALRHGPDGWRRWPRTLRVAVGPLLLAVAWLGLVRAHAAGVVFLLSVMCLVWVADIAAYAGGRAFGRRKLAPSISPGKTWEGALSGLAGVLLLALAWWAADRHFDSPTPGLATRLVDAFGVAGAVAALVLLAAASVLGDLVESLVKRAAGAKDSSRLLPGHGGVLDRIDALLPVFPLVAALGLS